MSPNEPASPSGRPSAAAGRPIRVLVVDDSAVQRTALIALLDSEPDLEVTGWAADGAEAVQAVARLHPDVVTMDLRMPRMDGVEAARRIMQETPTPIVMVTASAAGDDARTAFEALQAGVLTIVRKPEAMGPRPGTNDRQMTREERDLLRTVRSMAQVRVVRRWTPERRRTAPPAPLTGASPLPPAAAGPAPAHPPQVVVVGASTGGPQALGAMLPLLPATFPLPVLIVQHIAAGFAAGLVAWLSTLCALPVQLAAPGQRADRPGIVIAPTGQHLVVRGHTLLLTDEPPVAGHRPSATILFQSVAREYRAAAVGVLLSGMGDDGAAGLRDLKRAGAATVAQDEASSVVFGMPAAAIKLGIVDHVLPAAEIAPLLVLMAARRAAGGS